MPETGLIYGLIIMGLGLLFGLAYAYAKWKEKDYDTLPYIYITKYNGFYLYMI